MTLAVEGVGGQRYPQAAFTPGKDPLPIVQEAGQALRPVWIGAKILFPTWFRYPYLPARSESLYRLHYPGPQLHQEGLEFPGITAKSSRCVNQSQTIQSTQSNHLNFCTFSLLLPTLISVIPFDHHRVEKTQVQAGKILRGNNTGHGE